MSRTAEVEGVLGDDGWRRRGEEGGGRRVTRGRTRGQACQQSKVLNHEKRVHIDDAFSPVMTSLSGKSRGHAIDVYFQTSRSSEMELILLLNQYPMLQQVSLLACCQDL